MARPHLVFTAWLQLADTTIPTELYNPVALNINTTHTPYNVATAALRLQPVYSYGQSTVTVSLRLRPIYGYGQSTVVATLFCTASLPITVTVLLYLDHMHYQSATLVQ